MIHLSILLTKRDVIEQRRWNGSKGEMINDCVNLQHKRDRRGGEEEAC
jgi:hypothetical protein